MNRTFRPTSKLSSAVAAVAAIISSVLMLSAIGGLAEHYSSQAQVAQIQSSAPRA